MKINSINLVNLNNISYKKGPSPNNLERMPNSDWVSFTGKKKQVPQTVMTATTFGTQLYKSILDKNASFEDVKNLLVKYSSDVEVKHMDELKNVPSSEYAAYANSSLKEDFIFSDKVMYLRPLEKNTDDMGKLIFAMNTAHEYTHIKQVEDGKESEFYKNISGNNLAYAQGILALGGYMFVPFDTKMQHDVIQSTFNKDDVFKMFKYKTVVPRQCNINEEMIYKALKVKNKKEFEDMVNATFYHIFKHTIIDNNILSEYPEIMNSIPNDVDAIEFYKTMRKICAQYARNEAEAYTTESRIFKKTSGINKDLNIDIIPMYYEMLADALNK